jgi:dienelactone hydrolase
MKRIGWRTVAFATLGVIAFVIVGSLIVWTEGTLGPSRLALSMLQSDSEVRVRQETNVIVFEPTTRLPSSGFILYPGARVDFRSYSPVLREIAEENHLAAVLRAPLNLSFFNTDGADEVIAAYPNITHWIIGGHSLGGVVAAGYVANLPSSPGLALWASYPANDSLLGTNAKVLSIYGSNDGLTTPEDILQSQDLLPASATFIEIPGGNHSQFGSYGLQPGDGKATIAPEEQWAQIAEAMIEMLESDR